MKVISAAALSALFCTVVSASLKVKEEHRTAFFGEDIHIDVPPDHLGEVVFKSRTNSLSEVVLLRRGQVVNPRGRINSLGHLVLEDVQEEDEGVYVIKNTNSPNAAKHLVLIVRDCAVEQVVKYGDPYHIHLNRVEVPITLEFRPGLIQLNQTVAHDATEPPAVVLYNLTAVTAEKYAGRLSVSDKRVTLHAVRMTDEGSFTVLDRDGKIRRRNCLNVREHQDFAELSHGENLKIKLYLPYSNVSIVYRRKSDNQDRLILDRGVLATPLDPQLEGRLILEGTQLVLKKVHTADTGVFKVTDLDGFPVVHSHVEVEAYKLPPLTMAVLCLLSVIASMLLLCLLSCVYRMHKRNEKNRKLTLLAQQPTKGDGDAFRQPQAELLLGERNVSWPSFFLLLLLLWCLERRVIPLFLFFLWFLGANQFLHQLAESAALVAVSENLCSVFFFRGKNNPLEKLTLQIHIQDTEEKLRSILMHRYELIEDLI
ncbi:uncharacterized protein [Clinocottus analis]|uniref:uncharacterized protein isoform X2 n=1 Tax=Clinocottus analis TaxID=304258 RepID=UPI0035BF81C0